MPTTPVPSRSGISVSITKANSSVDTPLSRWPFMWRALSPSICNIIILGRRPDTRWISRRLDQVCRVNAGHERVLVRRILPAKDARHQRTQGEALHRYLHNVAGRVAIVLGG